MAAYLIELAARGVGAVEEAEREDAGREHGAADAEDGEGRERGEGLEHAEREEDERGHPRDHVGALGEEGGEAWGGGREEGWHV